MTVPSLTLPSGDELPTVGLGTWDLHGETVRGSIDAAIDAGYTHFDTAEGYENEAAVGDALAEYDREEVFLTSKALPKHLGYESLVEACEASLDRLGTEYLDLYLIHWPNPAISLRETLDAMALLHERGLVRNVGVSNFDPYRLSAALHITDVPIAVNQIELHPWFYRPELVEYCQEVGVAVEAAAPIARTVYFDEALEELAAKYEKTPAQVVLRWAVEKDAVVIPKSRSAAHVRENADLFDWELDPEDHALLDGQDQQEPVYDSLTPDWEDEKYGIQP